MSGVVVLLQLLADDSAVIAIVPDDLDSPDARISEDPLPAGTTLPALGVSMISSNALDVLTPGAKRQVTERIQVRVYARNPRERRALMKAVKDAGDAKAPAVDELTNVTVHLEAAGPDMAIEDAAIYLATQDFRVIYNEER